MSLVLRSNYGRHKAVRVGAAGRRSLDLLLQCSLAATSRSRPHSCGPKLDAADSSPPRIKTTLGGFGSNRVDDGPPRHPGIPPLRSYLQQQHLMQPVKTRRPRPAAPGRLRPGATAPGPERLGAALDVIVGHLRRLVLLQAWSKWEPQLTQVRRAGRRAFRFSPSIHLYRSLSSVGQFVPLLDFGAMYVPSSPLPRLAPFAAALPSCGVFAAGAPRVLNQHLVLTKGRSTNLLSYLHQCHPTKKKTERRWAPSAFRPSKCPAGLANTSRLSLQKFPVADPPFRFLVCSDVRWPFLSPSTDATIGEIGDAWYPPQPPFSVKG